MLIRDLMSSPVVTVTQDTTVKEAAALLVERGFSALPVVDGEELVGIVTEGDLLPMEAQPDPSSHLGPATADPYRTVPHTVAEVMSRKVLTRPPDTDAARAARAMLDHRLRSIPVTDHGGLVGIVTRRDLLRVLARRDQDVRRELAAALADELPDHTVIVEVDDGIVTLRFRGWLGPRDRRMAELLANTVPGVLSVREA